MRRTAALLALVVMLSLGVMAQQQEEFARDDVRIVAGPTVDAQHDRATITWQTNNNAATRLQWGTDRNNLEEREFQSGGRREHRVELTGLEPNTTYYFEVHTQEGVVRNRGQFRTRGEAQAGMARPAEEGLPEMEEADDVRIVEGPDVEEMADGRAIITWQTNNVAATHVRYGTDAGNLDQSAFQPGGRREHRVELTGLESGQHYHFAILTRQREVRTSGRFHYEEDQASPWAQLRDRIAGRAEDPEQEGPGTVTITNGPVVENVTQDTATIMWRTDTRSSSVVRYGTDPDSLNQVAIDRWGTTHRVTLPNLEPGTQYHFQVESSPGARRGPDTQTARGEFRTR